MMSAKQKELKIELSYKVSVHIKFITFSTCIIEVSLIKHEGLHYHYDRFFQVSIQNMEQKRNWRPLIYWLTTCTADRRLKL